MKSYSFFFLTTLKNRRGTHFVFSKYLNVIQIRNRDGPEDLSSAPSPARMMLRNNNQNDDSYHVLSAYNMPTSGLRTSYANLISFLL